MKHRERCQSINVGLSDEVIPALAAKATPTNTERKYRQPCAPERGGGENAQRKPTQQQQKTHTQSTQTPQGVGLRPIAVKGTQSENGRTSRNRWTKSKNQSAPEKMMQPQEQFSETHKQEIKTRGFSLDKYAQLCVHTREHSDPLAAQWNRLAEYSETLKRQIGENEGARSRDHRKRTDTLQIGRYVLPLRVDKCYSDVPPDECYTT